jgi:hypothetical protein
MLAGRPGGRTIALFLSLPSEWVPGLEEVEARDRRPVRAIAGLVLRAPGVDALTQSSPAGAGAPAQPGFEHPATKQRGRNQNSNVHCDES